MKQHYIVGIDEVGRGPLAGPVTVAAVMLPATWRMRHAQWGNRRIPLRDSKRLSAAHREVWFRHIKTNSLVACAVSHVTPRVIDRINISRAANLAATRALRRLATSRWPLATRVKVFLDGGLFADTSSLVASGYRLVAHTIIRGDEKYAAIKLASIIAKVRRDRYMTKKHKAFPQYGFAAHKGYGTKAHYRALRKHGPSPLHRLTFLH